ncbi:MAG: hypothetical protein ACOZAL_00055, partial [Patescibacteria group bacterium]
GLSSATLRNEMMELEKLGYLSKPHTSAGRIPTDRAYHFFIKSIDDRMAELPENIHKIKVVRRSLKGEGGRRKVEDLFKEITKTLAEMSGGLAFGGIKELNSFFQSGLSNLFREPEFEDKDYFSEMAKVMEKLEKHFNELFKEVHYDETKVFIGKENPLGKTKKLSIIISGCKMSNKKHGVIGLLGPVRMRYDYNISLINQLRKYLERFYEQG